MAFPGCEAVITVVPVPVIVKILPETVATPVSELLYETGSPELAVAVSANGTSF